jgi:hypothetical protein
MRSAATASLGVIVASAARASVLPRLFDGPVIDAPELTFRQLNRVARNTRHARRNAPPPALEFLWADGIRLP